MPDTPKARMGASHLGRTNKVQNGQRIQYVWKWGGRVGLWLEG